MTAQPRKPRYPRKQRKSNPVNIGRPTWKDWCNPARQGSSADRDREGNDVGGEGGLAEQHQADRGRLRAVACRIFGHLADADDAVQKTSLRLNRLAPLTFVLHDMSDVLPDQIGQIAG
jgi:hypothetical protein